MANPVIQIKRSAVAGKIPTASNLQLGELAVNTYDGKVYLKQDQGGVGVGTTVIAINPWSVGLGSNTYNAYFTSGNIGIGSTTPSSTLSVVGNTLVTGIVTASGGFNLGISSAGTTITAGPITSLNFVGSGNTFSVSGTTANISISGSGGATISTTAPSTPSAGNLWYNSNLGRTFIYYSDGDSSQWVDAAPFNIPTTTLTPGRTDTNFTATAGQTVFYVSYTAGYVDVYLNGIRLTGTEYIATNGTSVTLNEGAASGDIVSVVELRTGIGATGATGSGGPLQNITNNTTNATYYPIFAVGVGTTVPYINTTSNYFSFNASSGTLLVNQLSVTGVATATDFNSTSDINLKNNIKQIDKSLDKIIQIKGVTFDWKCNGQSSAGVIAQDIEKVLPEIVKEAEDGHKTLNYNGLIGLLIEAVKEQQETIKVLEQKINNLEERMS